ncbi:MAG: PepSY-associated TM helix domain-containing protein [Vicinamibacterales bacterium]
MADDAMSVWRQWVRQPQRLWLRWVLFQVHLWTGLVFGLYLFFISVTGSVLVYRNELFEFATPAPIVSTATSPPLTDDQLIAAAERTHGGFRVSRLTRAEHPDHAVEVHFSRDGKAMARLFDPRTGEDVGSSPPLGIWLVARLIELHDDLLAGPEGRRVNGAGAIALLVASITGLIVWWPGVDRWRRSLTVRRGGGWQRLSWDLHSALGFFSLAFLIVSAVSALYLCLPDTVQAAADWIEPPTDENLGFRYVDSAISWLAYLHFGRINGIGIPCDGPGFCDQATKAVWALFGLAPAVLFVTGTTMWWNRVLRPWRGDRRRIG